jgi:CRISPR system Cascade subunit CasA
MPATLPEPSHGAEPEPDPGDHFDLRTRPWIPVSAAGSTQLLGLRELFLTAHTVEGLAVALPPAAAGLLRVLYAMTARITRLDTVTGHPEWANRRCRRLEEGRFAPEDVDTYLSEQADGLRLHDPKRPFLQDARLAEQAPGRSGVNKLVGARPSGNNQVFFGHFTDDDQVALPSAEAALHLIALMYYGPSGQCATRTVDGQRFGNSRGGPLRRAMSYHPVGRTLFETLLLGIPAPGAWPTPSAGAARDGCPWEREALPDPLAPPPAPVGPLSALTERYQHAVLLYPGPGGDTVVDSTITWAFRDLVPENGRDPYLIYDEGRDGVWRPRDAVAERALWRDLDALVLADRGTSRRPAVLDGLEHEVPEEIADALRVEAYGFDQDGQTRDRTYFGGSTPELLPFLKAGGRDEYALARYAEEAHLAAEKAADRLLYALRVAWRDFTMPPSDKPGRPEKPGSEKDRGPWPDAAQGAYWPRAEEEFWRLLGADDAPPPMRTFGRLALGIYNDLTGAVAATPKGAKAREAARGLLLSLLADAGATVR